MAIQNIYASVLDAAIYSGSAIRGIYDSEKAANTTVYQSQRKDRQDNEQGTYR